MPFGFHLTVDTLPSRELPNGGSRSLLAVSGFRLRARVEFSIPSALSPASEALPPPSDTAPLIRPPEGLEPSRPVRCSAHTMAAADFSLRHVNSGTWRSPFSDQVRSPQVRPLTVLSRAPDLRSLIFDRESFAVIGPLALIGSASHPVSVRRPTSLAPRFFQRIPHGRRLAVHSGRCDLLPGGLTPPSEWSCWAHQNRRRADARLQEIACR